VTPPGYTDGKNRVDGESRVVARAAWMARTA
jgi:hypothetical protein